MNMVRKSKTKKGFIDMAFFTNKKQLNNGKTIIFSDSKNSKNGYIIADYLNLLPCLIVLSDKPYDELTFDEAEKVIAAAIEDLPEYVEANVEFVNGIRRLGLFSYDLLNMIENEDTLS